MEALRGLFIINQHLYGLDTQLLRARLHIIWVNWAKPPWVVRSDSIHNEFEWHKSHYEQFLFCFSVQGKTKNSDNQRYTWTSTTSAIVFLHSKCWPDTSDTHWGKYLPVWPCEAELILSAHLPIINHVHTLAWNVAKSSVPTRRFEWVLGKPDPHMRK